LAAVGTADATFDPSNIDVELNGVMVARQSSPGEDRGLVDLSGKLVDIVIDLKVGIFDATIMTNDLTHDYVHENSAYAT
jgi:glutamate N-acetyltransferase/amino-acid N-acetyltransferase